MKALLKTACGCTRMIDITDRLPEIEIPISKPILSTEGDKEIGVAVNTREFRYIRYDTIDDIMVLIYGEKL